MSIVSKTIRDKVILSKLWSLGTIDPGYNASEKFLIFQIPAAILKIKKMSIISKTIGDFGGENQNCQLSQKLLEIEQF